MRLFSGSHTCTYMCTYTCMFPCILMCKHKCTCTHTHTWTSSLSMVMDAYSVFDKGSFIFSTNNNMPCPLHGTGFPDLPVRVMFTHDPPVTSELTLCDCCIGMEFLPGLSSFLSSSQRAASSAAPPRVSHHLLASDSTGCA